ncbi:hypothetical protein F4808DRAFT_184733 [Astrocystis sublimbata]|nr:hypothetical protein F4808DRAFT_184733 [Astrocystis sublimbata]
MEDEDWVYNRACELNSTVAGFPALPSPPTQVRAGAFSYNNRDGLRAGDFSRASLDDLRLLFRANASSARRRMATKPWITAQLHLYDIPFNKSGGVAELRDTLEAAVKGRKCVEGGPPSVAAVQQQFRAQLARKREEYSYTQEREKHKVDVNAWRKQEFLKLTDPRAEALFDLNLFFSKYFVDDQGLPAPLKTPDPVILRDLCDWSEPLRCRVDGVPGLRARVTRFLTVIAWASEFERGIDDAFAMIGQPRVKADHATREATFDPERFLAKYFLDGLRGKPAPGKRTQLLVLEYWFTSQDSHEKLLQAVKSVPDLLVQPTNKPTPNSDWGCCSKACLIVGWQKFVIPQTKSWATETKLLEVAKAKSEERAKEKAILAKLKPHIDYARTHRSDHTASVA